MLSPNAIEAVSEIIDAGDFYRESHAKIYRVALELFQHGQPVDAITVADKLDETGELAEIGGPERIREIATLVPATSNAAHHARIVREMATLRGLTVVGEGIQQLGWERPGPAPELVDRAEQMVFDLAQHRIRGSFEHIEVLVRESFEQITAMYEAGEEMTGTPTGFRDVDNLTSGLQPGNLVVVAGRPSMGKSAFALGCAANLALQNNDPGRDLHARDVEDARSPSGCSAPRARSSSQKLRTGRLSPEDWPRLVKACDALTKAPIYVDDTRLTSMLEIRGKARRLKAREPDLGMIMVDYIQLMSSGMNIENRVQEVSQISRSLKVLAGDLEVPVVALSQLSRAVESRTDKRPLLSDLQGLGQHRAGRRPRDVPLPRRVLQRAVRGSGPRRGDPREAPQRPDRHREARVPQALREVLRPRRQARLAGGGMTSRREPRTRSGSLRARRSSRASASAASTAPAAAGARFLDAVRLASVRGALAPTPTSPSSAASSATRSSSAASTARRTRSPTRRTPAPARMRSLD